MQKHRSLSYLSYLHLPSILKRDLCILLLDVVLGTALLGLALIMLILCLQLSFAVTSNTGDGATNSTSNPVSNARAEVVELTLGFLCLALGVLFLALLL